MGVHHGGKLCYSLANLSFGQVDLVARKRAEVAGRSGAPAVTFDVSWLCYRCHGIEDVMAMISIFLDNGFWYIQYSIPSGNIIRRKIRLPANLSADLLTSKASAQRPN